MKTITMKPIQVFAEIKRVNDDDRTVEAYAFVNETVAGEGGLRLKRSAMEDATPDYLRWANVRRMHQADAVGVARSVEWDEAGAKMVLEVVDDDAWNKVKRGVYKGLSVGVQATLMRGKDVEKCRWIETSLVDRPKDPDAIITAIRADDAVAEYEVDVEEIERGVFATTVAQREKGTLRYMAQEVLASILWDIQNGTSADKEAEAREACAEFADYVAPICARGELDDPSLLKRIAEADDDLIQRLDSDVVNRAEFDDLQTRFEALKAERDKTTQDLSEALTRVETAEARVKELENTPAKPPIVRNTHGVDREFLANQRVAEEEQADALTEEFKRLMQLPQNASQEERARAAVRLSQIKGEFARLGVAEPAF
jgi:hypothetical protein